jgi:hypothetical protein
MPQLPEQIRPYVAAFAKYHFWILSLLVPLVLVPLLILGTGSLDTKITAQKSQIEGHVSALTSVQGIAEHPNDVWSKAVEEQTQKIQEETLAEWGRFWEDQQFLRVWPEKLGPDFLKAIGRLRPGANLERKILLRYQNTVPDLVRELPPRMGTVDLMVDDTAAAGAPGGGDSGLRGGGFGEGGPRGPGFMGDGGPRGGGPGRPVPTATGSTAVVMWRAEDQKRLFESFKWDKPPSTAQVMLAQEELWVYGVFCDVIKKANAAATGAFDAPIAAVDELAVGYLAAEDNPGGQGGGRIFMPQLATPAGGEMPGDGGLPPGGGGEFGTGAPAAAGRPAHPRFGGTGAAGPGMPGGEMPTGGGDPGADASGGVPAGSPDDALREWIYVDFSGKPLSAAELATEPSAKMVHLMPFVLRTVMDQRQLDALLADLAAAPVPIDVRQVRINPGATGSQAPGGRPMGPAEPSFSAPDRAGRPFDVVVEIRGSVGLVPKPDEQAIGGGTSTAGESGT